VHPRYSLASPNLDFLILVMKHKRRIALVFIFVWLTDLALQHVYTKRMLFEVAYYADGVQADVLVLEEQAVVLYSFCILFIQNLFNIKSTVLLTL
jgi:hypothetical protein